ncbi:MAG: tripartite tricarboxylate transporter substrate binding protein [Betaproteobacteria bacterium]
MNYSFLLGAAAIFSMAAGIDCSIAAEQPFPHKPIRFIVPLSAGAADTLTRAIGQKVTEAWGQPVVVENRPGAGTTLGTEIVARSAPDGYTLCMATFSHAVNATFYKKLPYDTLKSFAAVTLVAAAPNVLVVHPSLPVKTVPDLIKLAKAQPGKLNFASAGNGSSSHLAGELFKGITHVKIVHVPYKGAAPAAADLLGGHVEMAFDPLPSSIANIRSGKLRALAVTTAQRSPMLPNTPALAEAGAPGYELNGWSGIIVPAQTPRKVVEQWHAEVTKILQMPDVRSRFEGLGFRIVGNTPEQFEAFLQAEVAKWGKVVKAANISAN